MKKLAIVFLVVLGACAQTPPIDTPAKMLLAAEYGYQGMVNSIILSFDNGLIKTTAQALQVNKFTIAAQQALVTARHSLTLPTSGDATLDAINRLNSIVGETLAYLGSLEKGGK
jgi:hypothetical protein